MDSVFSKELHIDLNEAAIKIADRASIAGLRLVCRGEIPNAPGTGLPRGRLLVFLADALCVQLMRQKVPLVTLFPVNVLLTVADEHRTRISVRDPRSLLDKDAMPEAAGKLSQILKELVLGPFSS